MHAALRYNLQSPCPICGLASVTYTLVFIGVILQVVVPCSGPNDRSRCCRSTELRHRCREWTDLAMVIEH